MNRLDRDASPQRHPMFAPTFLIASLLCLYWAALFYGTHTRLPPGMLPGNSDKVIHFAAYAGLGVLLMTLRSVRGTFTWHSVAARWLVLAAYGAFDELTQMLVNRTADFHDWYADLLGAAFGLCMVVLVARLLRRLPRPASMGDTFANAVQN